MILQWKSTRTGKETRIFRGKLIAGLLKGSLWKNDAYGELNGHLLRFQTKSFWKPVTLILDIEGTKELGRIEYNRWKTMAVITYDNESYDWAFGSLDRRQWQIKKENDFITYSRNSFWKNEGDIHVENISPPLVLAGLFIYGYFWKITAAS